MAANASTMYGLGKLYEGSSGRRMVAGEGEALLVGERFDVA